MWIKTVCPKCGGWMLETVIATMPPITQYNCKKCGVVYEEKVNQSNEVVNVPLDLSKFREVR